MEGTRKQAISLRIASADLRKLKKLAERLGVRDSDVIRFAVKTMLARTAPLCDQNVRGRALLPAFVEAGADLVRHFDLDVARLEEIVNDGVGRDQQVESHDLQLIAMAGVQQTYGKLRLSTVPPGLATERRAPPAEDTLSGQLRGYLYSKYADAASSSEVVSD